MPAEANLVVIASLEHCYFIFFPSHKEFSSPLAHVNCFIFVTVVVVSDEAI